MAYQLAGLTPADPPRTAGFVGILVLLLGVELVERRRFGLLPRAGWRWSCSRCGCCCTSFCPQWTHSGFSRTLYLLLPFTAYFSLGRRVSYAAGSAAWDWCW